MKKPSVQRIFFLLILSLILSFRFTIPSAEEKSTLNKKQRLAKSTGVDRPFWAPNRIGTYIGNDGQFVSHIPTGSAGMEWPVGSQKTINFASGIWLAGKKNGEIVTAAAEFVSEFQPGNVSGHAPGVAGTPADPEDSRFKVYIINQGDDLEPFRNPDYINWPVQDGAPVDADGKPLLLGASTAWAVFNDFNDSLHTKLFQSKPMGVECQMTAWGFARPDAFGDMMFFRFKFINKSGTDITDSYVALWADIDLGDARDLVGCDTTLSLGYMYKTQTDVLYGDNPPAIGYKILQGPVVSSTGNTANISGRKLFIFKNLGLTSFHRVIGGGPPRFQDPENALAVFYRLTGLDNFGDPIINPVSGAVTKFSFAGNPIDGTGWLEFAHADKRFLMSSGPFTLADGDTQEVVMAIIIAQGVTGLESVRLLKQNSVIVQRAYDANFALPPTPETPVVTAYPDTASVLLEWDKTTEYYSVIDLVSADSLGNPTAYKFQGYNVFQLDSPALTDETKIKKIASFDVIDGVVEIHDDVYVPEFGQVVNMIVQNALDTGLQRHLQITMDAITTEPFALNKKYYFAVTAYGYNPFGIPRTLESPILPIEARPQSAPLGTTYSSVYGDSLLVTRISGKSDGAVVALVVNPAELTGHTYQVRFRETESKIVYDIVDVTGDEVKSGDLVNQGGLGNGDYPIVDGVFIKVVGPPVGINNLARSVGPDDNPPGPDGMRWVSGVNWGGAFLFGGLDTGANFIFGSTLGPTDYVTIDAVFTRNPTMSEATGWSRCYVYRRDLEFTLQTERGWAPFQSFDITDPANPRQLNVCFVEDADEGLADLIWNPIELGSVGGHEYVFFMLSDYAPDGAVYDENNFGLETDVLYALWPKNRGSHPYQEDNFALRITPNFVNGPDDVFEFSSVAPKTDDLALARQQAAELVNVFPNPYNRDIIDLNNLFEQVVTFTHLPESETTFRIYTISGDLVRKLDHTNGTQFEVWDLQNTRGRPVASGLYIIYIDMGKFGVKVVKLAVF